MDYQKFQMNRRGLMTAGGGLWLSSNLFGASKLAAAGFDGFVEVETTGGRVRGMKAGSVCSFKGVPYAGSVSGAGRFKAAPPVVAWTGVRDALELPPPSPQPSALTFGPAPAEDCLFVNIWTPAADGKKRPVMFYNHGGGFTNGSASSPAQDGSNLARLYDVVVVESNHRLGIMGYLFLGEMLGDQYPGNQGLLDIVAALRWTSANIEKFGGDPGNVFMFGESGGGQKTSCIYAMPEAGTLFHKASIESGPVLRLPSKEWAAVTARATMKYLNIDPGNAKKILDVPLAQLIATQVKIAGPRRAIRTYFGAPDLPAGTAGPFGPFMDGKHIPAHPFDPAAPAYSANKPLMTGTAHDEGVFLLMWDKPAVFNLDQKGFQDRIKLALGNNADKMVASYRHVMPNASLSELYLKMFRDGVMWVPSTVIAERKAAQHAAPVYMYTLAYPLKLKVPGTNYPMGTPHAFDISTKFANPEASSIASTYPGLYDNDISYGRLRTSLNMSEMWATFARTGHPAAKDQPDWPAYTPDNRSTMFIDAQCHVEKDPDRDLRLAWETLPVSSS